MPSISDLPAISLVQFREHSVISTGWYFIAAARGDAYRVYDHGRHFITLFPHWLRGDHAHVGEKSTHFTAGG